MEKNALKVPHVINYLIQAGLKLIQVLDLREIRQQMGVDCVEDILNWTINRPIWSTKEIVVTSPSDQCEDHWMFVCIQVVHHEAK